jgi:tetratricopeptide (TPR) repeat protein
MKLFGSKDHYDRSEILRKAETYRSRGRVRQAIREYEKVLVVDPHDIEVHTKVGPLYIRVGRKDQAKASLKRVIAWYDKQGFVEKAIATLRLALTLDRRDLAAHLRLADLYLGKRLDGDALRLLEGARRAFRRKRFLEEAIAVEKKILSIAPDNFRAQVSLIRRLWKAGRGGEAGERLWQMESQWALKRNKKRWRKTRWLLFRHAPSLTTSWGYSMSFLAAPIAYGPEKRGRFAS